MIAELLPVPIASQNPFVSLDKVGAGFSKAIVMDTKQCLKCKEVKATAEFYVDNTKADRLQIYCKQCEAERLKKYHNTHKEAIAAQKKEYRKKHQAEIAAKKKIYRAEHRAECYALNRAWRQANPEARKKITQTYLKKHPDRYAAHLSNSKLREKHSRTGKPRPPCEHCGKPGKEYHHPDYTRPYYVISLCVECHLKVHGRSPIFKAIEMR